MIDLARQREAVTQKDYFNIMTWARYMPTVSLQASYVKPYENSYFFTGGRMTDMTDDYYTYGFRVTMPLDINSYYTIDLFLFRKTYRHFFPFDKIRS